MAKSCRITIDSNVLLAVFLPQDRLKETAIKELKGIKKKEPEIIIHPLVLIETLSLLKYRGGIGLAMEAEREMAENFQLINEAIIINKKAKKYFQSLPKIGLIDAMLIDWAIKNRCKLLTLDKEMEAAYLRLKRRRIIPKGRRRK